eukprot:gene6766-1211_t
MEFRDASRPTSVLADVTHKVGNQQAFSKEKFHTRAYKTNPKTNDLLERAHPYDSIDMNMELRHIQSLLPCDRKVLDQPGLCPTFAEDIMESMLAQEEEIRTRDYTEGGPAVINESQRAWLVEYIIYAHMDCDMKFRDTAFLAVSIMDRFYSSDLGKHKLQQMGLIFLTMAAKHEEKRRPDIGKLQRRWQRWMKLNWTRPELSEKERVVLGAIDYRLTMPTVLTFLRRYNQVGCERTVVKNTTTFLAEISLSCSSLITVKPSHIAAAVVYLSRKIHNVEPNWNPQLEKYTGFHLSTLVPIAEILRMMIVMESTSTQMIRKRHKAESNLVISTLSQW